MKIREFQLDKLARARELQDEAAALHIPVPVMSWEYEIRDKDGNIEEKGIGKANSFTRNALNILAYDVGLSAYSANYSSAFGDGIISVKSTSGSIYSLSNYAGRYTSSNDGTLYCGTSAAAESLDSYELPSSGLTPAGNSVSSFFNTTTRKLITTLSRSFYNGTSASIDIVEAGIREQIGSGYFILAVRDVFDAISVAAGETLTWTYVTEVSYPNP